MHANAHGMARGCEACKGSGFVMVVPGRDGDPIKCMHGNNDGKADGCKACKGSGWAGLIYYAGADD